MESLLLDDDTDMGMFAMDLDAMDGADAPLPTPTTAADEEYEDKDEKMDIASGSHMPSDDEMLGAIHGATTAMPHAGPDQILCMVVDWMEDTTPYACDRTAALHFLSTAGPATPQIILTAISTGVAARIQEEMASSRPASSATTERLKQLNDVVEAMDEDAKRTFKRGVLGATVSIERMQPESPFETAYGVMLKEEESTRLHPAVVREMGLGHTLYWAPPRQSWDGDLRAFIAQCCSQSGQPSPQSNAFLLFMVGHTAYARLVADEPLMRAYLVSARQDERFTVFQYANRPAFLRRVRMVLNQAEAGDISLRRRLVELAEATPTLKEVLSADDNTMLAQRLRLLDTTAGMDFTLLIGKWRISLPH